MRRISLISVAFVGISLVGCTVIQMSHYIGSTAPGATLSRDPLSADVSHLFSGPPNSLRLQTDSLRLGFSCWNDGYTPLLVGPFVFPFFPIVLLSPILREPLKTDELEFAVHLDPMGVPMSFTPGMVEVLDANGRPLRIREIRSGPGGPPRINHNAYSPPKNKLPIEGTVALTEPTLFVFYFQPTRKTIGSRFRVTIHGLTQSGSSVALPVIELTAATGLELQMGP